MYLSHGLKKEFWLQSCLMNWTFCWWQIVPICHRGEFDILKLLFETKSQTQIEEEFYCKIVQVSNITVNLSRKILTILTFVISYFQIGDGSFVLISSLIGEK